MLLVLVAAIIFYFAGDLGVWEQKQIIPVANPNSMWGNQRGTYYDDDDGNDDDDDDHDYDDDDADNRNDGYDDHHEDHLRSHLELYT